MKKEFKLSEKRNFARNEYEYNSYKEFDGSCPNQTSIYLEEDVKEFIKLLKEHNINKTGKTLILPMEQFNKLAGEQLVSKELTSEQEDLVLATDKDEPKE